MKKLWFKNKTYGWGWTPASWEGWVVLIVTIALAVFNAERLGVTKGNAANANIFLVETGLIVLALIVVCYTTGEKPRWRFGNDDTKK